MTPAIDFDNLVQGDAYDVDFYKVRHYDFQQIKASLAAIEPGERKTAAVRN